MIRTVVAPLIRRPAAPIAAASVCFAGAGTVAIGLSLNKSDEHWSLPSRRQVPALTQCSSAENIPHYSSFSLKNLSTPTTSIEGITDEVIESCSLVVPTLEALHRAVRLVSTAVLIAADYQVNSMQRKHPNSAISTMYKWTFHSSGSEYEEHESQLHELETAIAHLERHLERAQHDYVNSDENINEEGSLAERTLAKHAQKEAMLSVANDLAEAQEALTLLHKNGGTTNNLHLRNAIRLLDLCRTNGGVYVKVGQHLANLDLLLPEEYIHTLSSLFDAAPSTTYSDVCQVVKEELGKTPEELFDDFSEKPFASASLAQVHTARCKTTGKKLAIKVQHKGLRDTSKGDLLAMATVVQIADKLFDEFKFGWICEELTPQLPKELDFINEGKNAEAAAAHLAKTGLDCIVPSIVWGCTSHRVLTMEFEEGFRATDVERMEKAGIKRRDVAELISSVFNSQIFQNGFVHCDPHEANVLLREHPHKKGKPQIVLVDHGLYKKLDVDFQEAYARLWKGIVVADIEAIKCACESLGVTKMYPLLSAMLTARPFDEVIERSQTRSFDASPMKGADQSRGDKAVIRGYAQRYIKEIIAMLDIVPRQMLLIFKMNDCLRHVDHALGSPANTLVVAGKYASKRVLESDAAKHSTGSFLSMLRSWLSYMNVMFRIKAYELMSRTITC